MDKIWSCPAFGTGRDGWQGQVGFSPKMLFSAQAFRATDFLCMRREHPYRLVLNLYKEGVSNIFLFPPKGLL